jgi:hypothetical protein
MYRFYDCCYLTSVQLLLCRERAGQQEFLHCRSSRQCACVILTATSLQKRLVSHVATQNVVIQGLRPGASSATGMYAFALLCRSARSFTMYLQRGDKRRSVGFCASNRIPACQGVPGMHLPNALPLATSSPSSCCCHCRCIPCSQPPCWNVTCHMPSNAKTPVDKARVLQAAHRVKHSILLLIRLAWNLLTPFPTRMCIRLWAYQPYVCHALTQ